MHVGLGVQGWMLTRENMKFARQIGATHLVVSLRHFRSPESRPVQDYGPMGSGLSVPHPELWTVEALQQLRAEIECEGLRLEAIENFEPADWYDVLLDGPRRAEQIARLKEIVRAVGAAGVPALGYNFSLAGVWGRQFRPVGRGGATAPVFEVQPELPMRDGMILDSIYDMALFEADAGTLAPVASAELWRRFEAFLDEIIPVAEAAGVTLALHPEDPPVPQLRQTPRLVYQPEHYDRVLNYRPSPSNGLEFCIGTLSEMPGTDIYEIVDHFSRTGRIGYVHLRNVAGKVPHYEERFIDEGDTDMVRVLRILGGNGYRGVIIPDHVPRIECAAPWHAGMAYTLGWMRAALKSEGLLSED
jgi:mannonate dehydratase